ncbi:GspE/PulE family protein [Sulfurimonas autotrophica]|uniref:Type II secretion system protein E n=1 Tax=Sulfurimonas autotrophica (strain ATCC BAA-671 / DSM 16294 / JCM 11897 / OK10) TaxID=563040 RepID=E0UUY3_SULAO|nr:GspE/PulE family protein [Sulfurimonas autotrophica]ADN08495.1 type II secretion system protein E [Sulfurimonas autotrophica DSM 16294]
MIQRKVRLGDILIKNDFITKDQLNEALKKQKELNYTKKLGEIFIAEGYVTQRDLLKTLSKQLDIDFVDLYGENINFNAIATKYPLHILQAAQAIPFKEDEDFVYIATSDPLNYDALEALERTISIKPVKIYLAYSDDIHVIFHRIKILQTTREIISEVKKELTTQGLKKEDENSAIMKLILFIAKEAINKRASDIHIEPDEKEMIVRSRIDGILHENFVFDSEIYNALSSRIKLLGNLDISEKRIPQDGRFSLVINEKNYDFRLSTTPTIFGESIVMRILDRDKVLLKLEDLGFEDENLDNFMDFIHSPNGIVLITGPTGSGKTTTLYAALNEIKNISNKVMTAEDPVEYRLPLVQQIQINEKTGLTFSLAVRSFLRQDPDIILIGEVRDFETLNSASQAALTGHLVFTTLHTNDAPGAIPRMIQMGLKPYLIADALVGIVGQRLVRKICPYCKNEIKLTKAQLSKIEKYLSNPEIKFYTGQGCSKCDFTGYFNRTMISEILTIDTVLAKMISENANKIAIIEYAESNGLYKPMIADGIKKALKGITTVEEVLRITKDR